MQIIPKQYFSIPKNLLDFLIEREVTTHCMGSICSLHYQYTKWVYLQGSGKDQKDPVFRGSNAYQTPEYLEEISSRCHVCEHLRTYRDHL